MLNVYLDEDLFDDLGVILRVQRCDALHTREAGLDGQSDAEQLAFATREGRTLVTANRQDFRVLPEAWLVWADLWRELGHIPHAGILVVPNPNALNRGVMAQLIADFAHASDPAAMQSRLFRWQAATGWTDLTAIR